MSKGTTRGAPGEPFSLVFRACAAPLPPWALPSSIIGTGESAMGLVPSSPAESLHHRQSSSTSVIVLVIILIILIIIGSSSVFYGNIIIAVITTTITIMTRSSSSSIANSITMIVIIIIIIIIIISSSKIDMNMSTAATCSDRSEMIRVHRGGGRETARELQGCSPADGGRIGAHGRRVIQRRRVHSHGAARAVLAARAVRCVHVTACLPPAPAQLEGPEGLDHGRLEHLCKLVVLLLLLVRQQAPCCLPERLPAAGTGASSDPSAEGSRERCRDPGAAASS